MLAKLFKKASQQHEKAPHPQARVKQADVDPYVSFHYGIPVTASILALDQTQSLLAVGTLDGRIKVIGGDNIEGILTSPKALPVKYLEFLENQGFLASVTTENEIQVWDLEQRQIAACLQWECNITTFSVIYGSNHMYIGSEYAIVSLVKYDAEGRKIILLPYYITANFIAEAAGMSLPDSLSVVGVLHYPISPGNKLLIAYENGLIILWDASEDKVVLVRGSKDLQVKDETVCNSPKGTSTELSDAISDSKQVEIEISSLCWVCNNGPLILAVGYVDGDIMFWDLSTAASTKDQKSEKLGKNVVKLQLSSGDARLPVIVLRWSANRFHNHPRGQLFVYGGGEIRPEEVLTVLSLDWSSGIENLKSVARIDLTLLGSFADMVLLPAAGAMENGDTMLFVLTNQGQLHVYDNASLSDLMSQQKKRTDGHAMQYPKFIPTIEPLMTVAKLTSVHRDGEYSSALSKKVADEKINAEQTLKNEGAKWPLTGGVPSQLFNAENHFVDRLYIVGYQDGSVRIWDATYPALSLIFVIGPEVKGIRSMGATGAVSALELCSVTLGLAVGDTCGLVRLYKLIGGSDETELHFVTKTETEDYTLQQGNGPWCTVVFSILDSPICILQYANFGSRLSVGYECGQVAMLDISTLSVLFLTDSVSNSSSPVSSLSVKSFSDTNSISQSPKGSDSNYLTDSGKRMSAKDSDTKTLSESGNGLAFIMTESAHVIVIDSATGNMIKSWPMHSKRDSTAISMYIIEDGDALCDVSSVKLSLDLTQQNEDKVDDVQPNSNSGGKQLQVDQDTFTKTTYFWQRSGNIFVLLCCDNTLHWCSLKSALEGDSNSIQKVNLSKPCCWTSIFRKDGKDSGLVVLYQTGIFQIRSFPNLEVVRDISLMTILRWNFKTNMDKTVCSSDHGQIILVYGCEVAFVSLLTYENAFRISESLPCLHDKVLAAATDVIANSSLSQNQSSSPGILGGIIKGFTTGKTDKSMDRTDQSKENYCANLESLFSNPPFLKPSTDVNNDQETMMLNLDDIVLNGPITISAKIEKNKNEKKDKGTEKKKLFESATSDAKPKMRTASEVKAKYRETGDVSAAASRARDMLAERQQKLEKLRDNTEELASGAQDFASMAKELAKRMENRKWWQI